LRADKIFLGVRGIHPSHGILADDFKELEKLRSFVKAAERVIVLADHTKFSQTGPAVLCPAKDIDTIITDKQAPQNLLDDFLAIGVEVRVCEDAASPG
jgi:DeoR/GlpR family transcriptional regulator of sugar metabolism